MRFIKISNKLKNRFKEGRKLFIFRFKSNNAMRRVCLSSEEKQKVLAGELQQIKETYEKLVQSNLLVEKKLRDQKYSKIIVVNSV